MESNTGLSRRKCLQTIGIGSVAALCGCVRGNNSGSSSGTTLDYTTDRGGTRQYIRNFIEDFESRHENISVNAEFVTKGASLQERLAQRIAAGNPPDIAFSPATTVYRFAVNGNAVPMTSLADELGVSTPARYQGDAYMIPAMRQAFSYWYRSDLYSENPTTRSEWLQDAKRISQESDTSGFLALSGETNTGTATGTQLAWSSGADIITGEPENMEVVLDQEPNRSRMIEGLEWYDSIHQYSSGGAGYGWGDSYNSLAQGSSAAVPGLGSDPALTVRNNNPDIYGNLAGSFAPHSDELDGPNQIWSYAQGHWIHSAAENPNEAKTFIREFQQGDQIIDWLLESPMYLLPPQKEMMNNDRFLKSEFISQHRDTWKEYRNDWDKFTSVLETANNGAANILGPQMYQDKTLGWMLGQLITNDREPGTLVDETANRIRALQN